jgi:hypothetical protein
MQRTINHTGRRKIERKEVSVQILERQGQPPEFEVEFAFDKERLPEDGAVYVEAYSRNTLQRFEFGTVNNIQKPARCVLDKIDLSGKTLFRVRVIDETENLGRLVADVQGLNARSDDEASQKSSLIILAARPLGQQTWKVNIPDNGKPELIINNMIPDALNKLRSNSVFQALILPAALKQVLMFYLWGDEIEGETVQAEWIAFAEHLAGEKPHSQDPEELAGWIDDVVERFSERFELREMLNLRLEEVST